MTEWRVIKGEEGRYAVSDAGEVMAMNFANLGVPGILKPNKNRGYFTIQLSNRKRRTIHRLVAEAFIGPRPVGMQINHKNGIKNDNRLSNLEYCTPSENMKHCFATGLQSNVGERHSRAKLTDAKIIEIRRMLALGFSQIEIGATMGVSSSAISLISSGKRWSHVGKESVNG